MNDIATPINRKQRALTTLLSAAIALVGLVAALNFNSLAFSAVTGAFAGFLTGYLSDRIWPLAGMMPGRRQRLLFYAVVIVPSGVVAGVVLARAIGDGDLLGTYLLSFVLASLAHAVLQLRGFTDQAAQ